VLTVLIGILLFCLEAFAYTVLGSVRMPTSMLNQVCFAFPEGSVVAELGLLRSVISTGTSILAVNVPCAISFCKC
jgi:hypothetical protein